MKPARRFPSIERLEDRIAPATFLVTSLFDNTNPGSLRAAIAEANANPGPDTITFKAGLAGTLNVNLGPLTIEEAVKIKGPGAGKLAIDGGGFLQIFRITNPATEEPVSISGFTLSNAGPNVGDGRAIYSTEPLSLTDVSFVLNAGFSANGGALYVETSGNISIKNSRFISNQGGLGGAAMLKLTGPGAKVAISNSVFQDNRANVEAGALYVDFSGPDQTLTLERSTFLVNQVAFNGQPASLLGGAITVAGLPGAVVVKGSTFTENTADSGGGAIFQDVGSLTVDTSTFTSNRATTPGGAIDFRGDLFTAKNSTFIANQSASAMFGGGAVRLDGVDVWKVTGSKFIGNGTTGNGGAIHATGGAGEVSGSTFRGNDADNDGGAVFLSPTVAGALTVKKSLFVANGAGNDGGAMSLNGALTALGCRFLMNRAGAVGGALFIEDGETTITASLFEGNSAASDGGAIRTSTDENFTVLGSTFRFNQAGLDGGALCPVLFTTATFTMKGCTVTGNVAAGVGGGVGVFGNGAGTVLFEKVRMADNRSTSDGGGLYLTLNPGTIATVTGSTFTGNTTDLAAAGGGIALTAGSVLVLTKNSVTGNIARTGGGVFSFGTVTATANKISGNFAFTAPDTSGF